MIIFLGTQKKFLRSSGKEAKMTFKNLQWTFLAAAAVITSCGVVPATSKLDPSQDQTISPIIQESDAKNVRYVN
ncbi:MAG: hypothetical protein EBU49_09195, partial [Proteobacteria bacterium]|nr:hypothetical protein [Pseudomonadota bacterium]